MKNFFTLIGAKNESYPGQKFFCLGWKLTFEIYVVFEKKQWLSFCTQQCLALGLHYSIRLRYEYRTKYPRKYKTRNILHINIV